MSHETKVMGLGIPWKLCFSFETVWHTFYLLLYWTSFHRFGTCNAACFCNCIFDQQNLFRDFF